MDKKEPSVESAAGDVLAPLNRPLSFLLGLPFHPVNMAETVAICRRFVAAGKPRYVITANVDFVAQAYSNERLRPILLHADLAVCDGMPLVWLSRWFKPALPERVAGSDLVFHLFAEADRGNWRVFFLGSDEATLKLAGVKLAEQYPNMVVADSFSPPFGPVENWPNAAILERIGAARPDVLLVAVGCPKQEYWIHQYAAQAGVPLSIGIGASLDFIAGSQRRAPKWLQKTGLEWLWRLGTDPMRLAKRYAKDFKYLLWLSWLQWRLTRRPEGRRPKHGAQVAPQGGPANSVGVEVQVWPATIDLAHLEQVPRPLFEKPSLVLDLSAVTFMDSSGIGLLVQIARDARQKDIPLQLRQPSETVARLLATLKLSTLFVHERSTAAPYKVLLSAGMIQQGKSGVGRYVVELANRMSGQPGFELLVAGLDSDRHLFPKVPDASWRTIPERSANGWRNLLWHQVTLRKWLRTEGIDLYHSPSYRRVMAACPVAQVATVHDCAPFRLHGKYGLLRGLFGRQLVPFLVRRCAKVLTVSEFTAADLKHFFALPAERIEVILNGIDRKRFYPLGEAERTAFRSRLKLPERYFLYVSRLEHPGKNHVRLLEAYDRFRGQGGPAIALVLGGADWHGAEVIRQRVAASRWRADIHLPGFMDDHELPLWYNAAFALVFPSLMEGFGLPVAEAMACAVPVACSDRGSLPEVAGGAAHLFNPESIDEMSAALLLLASAEPPQRQGMQQQGLHNAKRFDWAIAAELTAQVYRSHAAKVAKI